MSTPISVVIITYNEERNIARCIQSVLPIADEIIVVDSFSTDNTEKICSEYKVTFIQHPFEGHIEQKNYALAQANFNYVLSLDADEALSEKLLEEVKHIKANCSKDAYSFNRLTNFCGKWIKYCGWYPDKKTRLWNRNKGKWGGVNPHDKVIMQPRTTTQHINADILHYSFNSIDEHLKQIAYFTDISSKAAFEKGIKSSDFKIVYKTVFKFFRDYILKLGILDGKYGYIICKNSAYAKYLKYNKLKHLQQSKK
ncbi:MAG: glycosyl transferase [Flavobacteriales bacterium]|mgnify:CR=1 FL=1|jgi:glycosyltransferase involved in cell wall biosynthesis|nr:glycosyl transferase [Flavobacteriales bacterium]|tara:strand:- start:428273 stop:429034 length:762 start_codon:yes stop_codon:yes gene_type:complete